MQVGSEIREISCVSLTGFQMKIHCNFEVWSKENSTGAACVDNSLTGTETGDFGGVITNNSQTYRHFSNMFVAILVINYESTR